MPRFRDPFRGGTAVVAPSAFRALLSRGALLVLLSFATLPLASCSGPEVTASLTLVIYRGEGVPLIYQLYVTMVSAGVTKDDLIPRQPGSKPLSFPGTYLVSMTRAVDSLEISVEGLGSNRGVVASGKVTVPVAGEGQKLQAAVTLQPGSGSGDGGLDARQPLDSRRRADRGASPDRDPPADRSSGMDGGTPSDARSDRAADRGAGDGARDGVADGDAASSDGASQDVAREAAVM
jgi:hypothetical protein